MATIPVELAERGYPVHVERSAIERLGAIWAERDLGSSAAIITDKTVEKHHGARVLQTLRGAGVDAQLIPVPPGEPSKSWQWADRLYTRLGWAAFDRGATVVALGGGVVGDLAGFVAATYMRGIDWVAVPTTLLAQVDAAIGGKTGINHRLGKNLVGAFHQPRAVVADPELLTTLDERQLANGFAEVVKYGLIADPALFDDAERILWGGRLAEVAVLASLVERSVAIKSGIVARDEREANGERALLNFGHTLGHALEAATDYGRFLHGEAVVWGMWGEARIAHERGRLPGEAVERIDQLVDAFAVPAWPDDLDVDEVVTYVRRDKKADAGRVRCVLLDALGDARLATVDEAEVRQALESIAQRPPRSR
ncbi:MAG: 3-dehydroquinate synthase [Candidatus Bipolaricaulia bacterium]